MNLAKNDVRLLLVIILYAASKKSQEILETLRKANVFVCISKGTQYHDHFTVLHTIECLRDEQNRRLATRNTHSEVITLYFRGHGQIESTPGYKYSNQYVDHLEEVLKSYSFAVEEYSSSDSNKHDSVKT